jgi:TP53 regulating kinase-like protein
VLDSLYPSPQVYNPSSSTSSLSPASSSAGPSIVLKHRFPKTYRHPSLDASLTKSRLSFEARALARCSRAGVTVPTVLWVDETHGVLGLEKIEGWSVREVLGGGAEGEAAEEDAAEGEELDVVGPGEEQEESEGMKALKRAGVSVEDLMGAIGTALARLHVTTIVHGDLTTSNMMVRLTPDRPGEPFEIVSCTVPHAEFGADSSGVDRFWIDNDGSVCGKLCCGPLRAGTGICFDTSAI